MAYSNREKATAIPKRMTITALLHNGQGGGFGQIMNPDGDVVDAYIPAKVTQATHQRVSVGDTVTAKVVQNQGPHMHKTPYFVVYIDTKPDSVTREDADAGLKRAFGW